MLTFTEEGHKYTSIKDEGIKWTSVTKIVEKFTNPFDSNQHIKCSKNKKSKWYGMEPSLIKSIWEGNNKNATDLGTWYHKRMESALTGHETIVIDDKEISIVKPIVDEMGIKYAPEQKLENNKIYPEHFVYLKSVGICGQADRIKVIDNKLFVEDFKSNKEIKFESYKNWEGHKMMLSPLNHLMDCNWIHYSLQLSLYAYIILKHNPRLSLGGIEIIHVIFEEEGRDEYDYPIYKRDNHGDYIVKDEIRYPVNYLKQECQLIMNILRVKK